MTDEQINEQVAIEVMGLPFRPWGPEVVCPHCGELGRYCGSRSWCSECQEWYYSAYKDYDVEIELAMQVEDRIAELGLQSKYADELTNIVSMEKGKTQLGAMRFDLIQRNRKTAIRSRSKSSRDKQSLRGKSVVRI